MELRGAELAQAVAEYITEHPEDWDQGDWGSRGPECGTSMCFGGTAIFLSGEGVWTQSEGNSLLSFLDIPDRDDDVREIARDILRLNHREGERLFYEFEGRGREGVRDMWHLVASLYGSGQIAIPAEYA